MARPINGDCACSASQVDLMFKKSEQYIDSEITDRTAKIPSYWISLYPVKGFPDGVGLNLEKMIFHGDIGPQYDGFDGWRQVQISRSSAEAALCGANDGCGYNWEEVGHGIESKSYSLMQRDLKTKPICVKDIRTFRQYQEFQNLIFKNLTRITNNIREQFNRNAAYGFANKHVALPALPYNTKNPKGLPNIPAGVEVGKLTYRLLLDLYPGLAAEASEQSIAQLDGMPMFGVIGTPETLNNMSYEDADLRKDLRYCQGESCNLIKKYNFLDAIGPFVLMPDVEAPRYNRDANGNLTRVFRRLRNMPIEIGTRPMLNPDYDAAEFELILILTKDLFTLRSRRPLSTVGGQTNFDPEVGMLDWKWHNPERWEDPNRRVGFYYANAEIGVEPGDFTDITALLVKIRPAGSGIQYWPAEVCPNGEEECDQELGDQTCPCPQVVGMQMSVSENDLILFFDRDTGLVLEDSAEIRLRNGGSITGEVAEASDDGTRLRITFESAVCMEPGTYVELVCTDTDYCTAKVVKAGLCNMVTGSIDLALSRPIKAGEGDTITLFLCDETTVDVAISAVDAISLTYTVPVTYAAFCAAGGVKSVCVPTATDATCPDCDASSLVDCEDEESSS